MEHNYGINQDVAEKTPITGQPIRLEKPYKKVILVNVADCKNKITVAHVTKRLQGTSWYEWEELLAQWLVRAIVEAIQNGQTEADITKMFSCDLQGEDHLGPFFKKQEMIIPFLMGRLFECVTEDDKLMRVRIIKKSICED